MVTIHEDECAAAGLDPEAVKGIARRISRAALDARRLGLTVFGGSGSGSLRFDDGGNGPLIVADLGGSFDGGDGAENFRSGLRRGEGR